MVLLTFSVRHPESPPATSFPWHRPPGEAPFLLAVVDECLHDCFQSKEGWVTCPAADPSPGLLWEDPGGLSEKGGLRGWRGSPGRHAGNAPVNSLSSQSCCPKSLGSACSSVIWDSVFPRLIGKAFPCCSGTLQRISDGLSTTQDPSGDIVTGARADHKGTGTMAPSMAPAHLFCKRKCWELRSLHSRRGEFSPQITNTPHAGGETSAK